MKEIPTTWDETVFIDGYPGKYIVLARRHGNRWYIAGINAQKEPLKLTLNLPMLAKESQVTLYSDGKQNALTVTTPSVKSSEAVQATILPQGGIIFIAE